MELNPKYKQTEVGIIPRQWEVVPLQKLGSFAKGKGILKEDARESGRIPAIPYTALYTDFSEIVDYDRIKWFVDHEDGTYVVSEPCVLIASSSNMEANTGKASALTAFTSVAVGREVIILKGVPSSSYISYQLSSQQYRRKTLALARGTTIKHLYPATFVGYKIAVPPSDEQHAIATALSDVDALLSALDRLIAKMRDLKQAAMQQLLTGQTRLPGFRGEWELKRLGNHLEFLSNGANSRAELTEAGRVRYLHYGDIHSAKGMLLNPATTTMPFLPEGKAERLDRLKDGDLVFADASEDLDGVGKSIELQNVRDLQVVSGMHTIAVRFDKRVLADRFKTYLQLIPSFRNHLRRLAAGTKVYATNMAHIASAEVLLPGTDEQTAIATVLSDMDAEIEALEARRAKTRDLKQAMMQELLTGRTRLIPPALESGA